MDMPIPDPIKLQRAVEWLRSHEGDTTPMTQKSIKLVLEGLKYYQEKARTILVQYQEAQQSFDNGQ